MPSRFVTLMIILFWFFTVGWFVKREFLPSWLASDSSPEFSVDLADEAAPRITSWNIFQGEKKLGYLNSKLSFLGKEDAFEIENRLQSMVVKMGILQYNLEVHIPSIRTVSVIDRNGQLRKQSTSGKFQIYFNIGPQAQDSSQSLSFEAELEGEVREGQFQGQSFLRTPFGEFKNDLTPFPVTRGNLFNPMQPQDRIFGLTPGRSWKMTLVDPVSETISQATFQTLNNLAKQAKLELPLETLKSRQAPEIIAEVLAEPQQLLWKDVQENCQVIEYRNDSVTGRTWVRISDGKVLQQEATGFGEKLKLVRDN